MLFRPSRVGVAAVCLTAAFACPSFASEPDVLTKVVIDQRMIDEIREWIASPIIELGVIASNALHHHLDQAQIDALDRTWRNEREAADQPLVAAVLGNPVSNFLTQVQAQSIGLYTELFVMDRHGLNVGQSAITSDFWQGDESKFQNTFPQAPGTVFVDNAEYHEGTGTWRAQVNMALTDTRGGRNIGAVTVEVNLTELARRRALGL